MFEVKAVLVTGVLLELARIPANYREKLLVGWAKIYTLKENALKTDTAFCKLSLLFRNLIDCMSTSISKKKQ